MSFIKDSELNITNADIPAIGEIVWFRMPSKTPVGENDLPDVVPCLVIDNAALDGQLGSLELAAPNSKAWGGDLPLARVIERVQLDLWSEHDFSDQFRVIVGAQSKLLRPYGRNQAKLTG